MTAIAVNPAVVAADITLLKIVSHFITSSAPFRGVGAKSKAMNTNIQPQKDPGCCETGSLCCGEGSGCC